MVEPITIDCDYLYPQFAAAYLMREGGRAAFIENNTSHAVPKLLACLSDKGLTPDKVDYLIVTHAHLDHAGGTSALLAHCPNAQVLAHPKAARTLIDPERLIRSARKVYGEDVFDKLYGKILPIEASRVRAIGDDEVVRFGGRELRFFYTLGHATHHFCIQDSASRGVFTGDSFGLRYPALQGNGLFIFPTTSPIDFDPEQARLSIQKIVECGATHAYLTHFGKVEEMEDSAGQLLHHLDAHEQTLEQAQRSDLTGPELVSFCETQLHHHFALFFEKRRIRYDEKFWKLLRLDLDINAAGIAFVAEKRRTSQEK